ncbi:hypothetical protein I79_011126 [Cricetulus griseus]|uniref:Uncharacterized protein n=1 Tax=Cricetulus griseus TaxID=10029 RepID=G3HKA7_CRIGR|nr:hypothetical protein I79_011126 [Cricetulus griseus]
MVIQTSNRMRRTACCLATASLNYTNDVMVLQPNGNCLILHRWRTLPVLVSILFCEESVTAFFPPWKMHLGPISQPILCHHPAPRPLNRAGFTIF